MRVLATIGALAIVVALGCAVYFFGGYYSVAGTTEDPAAVTWALTKVRTASIERHANDTPPTSLNDTPRRSNTSVRPRARSAAFIARRHIAPIEPASSRPANAITTR